MNIRTTPLENTTIKANGRKRNPHTSKMARRPISNNKHHKNVKSNYVKRSDSDKRRRSSLLRRLNSKKAGAEIHQLMTSSSGSTQLPPLTPPPVVQQITPSRSYQSLHRTLANASLDSAMSSSGSITSKSPPACRLTCSQSDSSNTTGNSSVDSSPSNSVPNSPASTTRPSSLHGLKHKLIQTFRSPRRKSCGHIPLSPLARTQGVSPAVNSLQATSPTSRSPSPLAFPNHHQIGSSLTTQTFLLQKSSPGIKITPNVNSVTTLSATNLLTPINKKTQTRPKSAEGVTPILQRSVSPDHLIVSKSLDSNNAFASKLKRESFSGFSPLALLSSPPIVMSKLAFDTSTQKQINTFVNDKMTVKLLENSSEQSSSDSVSTSKISSIDKNQSDSVSTSSETTYFTTVSIRMSSKSSSSETTTHSTLSNEKNSNTKTSSMSETTKCSKQSSSSSNTANSSSSSGSTSVMSKSGKTTTSSSKIVIKQSSSEKRCKKDSNRSSSSKSLNSGKGNSSK